MPAQRHTLPAKIERKSFGPLEVALKILRNGPEPGALGGREKKMMMTGRSFEIRLIGPSGRVAEVYMTEGQSIACAIAKAKILLDTHPEIAGAQIRYDQEIVPVEYETLH
jgi:hypothetical protein